MLRNCVTYAVIVRANRRDYKSIVLVCIEIMRARPYRTINFFLYFFSRATQKPKTGLVVNYTGPGQYFTLMEPERYSHRKGEQYGEST